MKVIVLRRFNDKVNKVIQTVGSIIEVTEDRFEEIKAASKEDPFVEIVENDGGNSQTELPVDLSGTVDEVKELITSNVDKEMLSLIHKAETEGKNRKGVIEHIEHLLNEVE
jgi:hypothetical protein